MIIKVYETENKKFKVNLVYKQKSFHIEYYVDGKLIYSEGPFQDEESAEIQIKNFIIATFRDEGIRYRIRKASQEEIIEHDPLNPTI